MPHLTMLWRNFAIGETSIQFDGSLCNYMHHDEVNRPGIDEGFVTPCQGEAGHVGSS